MGNVCASSRNKECFYIAKIQMKLKKWRKKQVQCSRLGRPTYSRKLDGFDTRKKLIKTKMGKM